MPIYHKSTVELVRQYVDERPDQNRFTSDEILHWFRNHWPSVKESTIRAHLIRMSTNAPSRTHHTLKPGVHDLFYQLGPREYRRYNPVTDPPPIYTRQDVSARPDQVASVADDMSEAHENELSGSAMFAYEAHLRDYLASNLHVLEHGLRLYEDEGIKGIEYPIRNRRIDLLAEAADNSLVVIELKVLRGHDRTIGQLLTYMGWVRQDLADGRQVRGMIVANIISDELMTAVRESNATIVLYEYELSFRVRRKQ